MQTFDILLWKEKRETDVFMHAKNCPPDHKNRLCCPCKHKIIQTHSITVNLQVFSLWLIEISKYLTHSLSTSIIHMGNKTPPIRRYNRAILTCLPLCDKEPLCSSSSIFSPSPFFPLSHCLLPSIILRHPREKPENPLFSCQAVVRSLSPR